MQLSREERIEVLMDKLMEIWEEFEMLDDEPYSNRTTVVLTRFNRYYNLIRELKKL